MPVAEAPLPTALNTDSESDSSLDDICEDAVLKCASALQSSVMEHLPSN